MRWILTLVMMAFPALACGQEAPPLATEKDKLSYAMGMDLGQQLKTQSVEIDPAVFGRGLADALSGGKTLLTPEEARAAITELQKAMIVKRAEAARLSGEKNKVEGEAFLAANKAKPDVVTLPRGLQYKILTPGTGGKPLATDTVVCQYRGTTVDGKEFDSSYKRGDPASFPLNKVIRGWTEALQLMPLGSKWQVFIPPALASSGVRSVLPPDSASARLGMEHSTMEQPLPEALAPDMSQGYSFNGRYIPYDAWFLLPSPAGALSVSGTDMGKFMLAHLKDGQNNGGRILKPETTREMHSRSYSVDPALPGIAHGFYEATLNGRRVLSHRGDYPPFDTLLALIPEEGTGLFVGYNSETASEAREPLLNAFMDHYYPGAPLPAPQATAGFATVRAAIPVNMRETHPINTTGLIGSTLPHSSRCNAAQTIRYGSIGQ